MVVAKAKLLPWAQCAEAFLKARLWHLCCRAVHHTEFSESGIKVFSASDDKSVRLWDLAAEAEQCCFDGHEVTDIHRYNATLACSYTITAWLMCVLLLLLWRVGEEEAEWYRVACQHETRTLLLAC